MSQHRPLLSRNGSWHDPQPDGQEFSPSIISSSREPWLQSLHQGPMATNLPYDHTVGNYLGSDGMGLVPFSSDAAHVLPGPHHANTLINEELTRIYHLQGGVFDPSLQYAMPRTSLNSTGDFQQIGHWNHEVDTGVETTAVNLDPITQYGIMSVVPGTAFTNLDDAVTEFGPYSGGLDHRSSVSPSQSSSAVGSSSTSATMDLSSRSSSVYPSHSVVSNSSERAQPDAPPFLISAATAPAATGTTSMSMLMTTSTTTTATATATSKTAAASKKGKRKAAPAQQVDAIMGPKRSHSINAAQERDRNTGTISAGIPIATEYTTPSANAIPDMVYAADGPPFSTSPSHSELSNHSQVPVPAPVPVPQVPRSSQRQRNRRAATKCREKTKAAVVQLEATEKAVSLEHMELSKTVTELRGEVLALKNQLLLHGTCDCDVIQKYLRNAARSIGEGASVNYTPSRGRVAAWPSPPLYSRHNSAS